MSKRDVHIDLLSGVFIIYMIYYHICQHCEQISILHHILFYFMPWFFYKSGMYFKHNINYLEALKKDSRALLMPYVSFGVIGLFIHFLIIAILGDDNWIHYVSFPKHILLYDSIPGNVPLWFLISLFVVKNIYNYFVDRINCLVLIIVGFAIAYCGYFFEIKIPRWLFNIAFGLCFYLVGSKLRKYQYSKFVFTLSIITCTCISILCPSYVDMFPNILKYGNYLVYFFYAISCIVIVNNLSKIIPLHFYDFLIFRGLSYLGQYSMFYYVSHWIWICIFEVVFADFLGWESNSQAYYIYMVLSCFLILPVIFKIFKNNLVFKKMLGYK